MTLVAVVGLIVALAFLVSAGRSFLPDFNEGSLTVGAVTLPGTALEESDRLGRMVEEILLQQPEVVSTARRTGRAEQDPHAQDVHSSEIEVRLPMGARSKEALLAALREDLTSVPGTNIVIGQPISHRIDHMLSGTRANIAIKIFGPDLYELRRQAQRVQTLVADVPGAVDVAMEQQADIPFLTVEIKRAVAARHGLSVRALSEAIEAAFVGLEVSRVLEGEATFDLIVRYDPDGTADLERIRSTLITTATGARLPLHALADIRKDRGPNTISRENVQRKIVVMANVAGRDLQGVVDDIRDRIAAQAPLPSGYHVEFGGQFESAEQAAQTLLILGFIVTVGIFLLLFVAFRSARDAFLIMLNLPLALIGGVIGVFISGRCAIGGLHHRLHHPVRDRNAQWRDAHRPHPQPGGARGHWRAPGGGQARGHGTFGSHLHDGTGGRPRPDSIGACHRSTGQRDPGPNGHRDPVRTAHIDRPEHDRGARALPAVRKHWQPKAKRSGSGTDCGTRVYRAPVRRRFFPTSDYFARLNGRSVPPRGRPRRVVTVLRAQAAADLGCDGR